MNDSSTIKISVFQMEAEFLRILLKLGFQEEKAKTCASVFTNNSIEGVSSHGVNRFPRFVNYILNDLIDIDAEPERIHSAGAIEQWDGKSGPGHSMPSNAPNVPWSWPRLQESDAWL